MSYTNNGLMRSGACDRLGVRRRRAAPLRLAGLGLSMLLLPGCALDDDLLSELRRVLEQEGHEAHSGGSAPRDAGSAASPSDGGGSCDGDCSGAACVSGACELLTLAEGPFRSLAYRAPHLYVVEETVVDGGTNTEVVRRALDGSHPERVAGGQSALGLGEIVVDASHLYGAIWLRPGHNQLWRVPLSGGGFSAEEGGLLLGEVSGGLMSVAELQVNDSYLVALFTRPTERILSRTLARFDKQGGTAGVFTTIDPEGGSGLALGELEAYVVRGFAEIGGATIVGIPLAGGELTPVASADPGEDFRDVARVGEDLVIAAQTRVSLTPAKGRIGRVPAAGGAIVTLSTGNPYRVIADSEFVYYFSETARGCLDSGSELYRLPLDGSSAPVLLASEPTPGCIRYVAADSDAVYWLTNDPSSDVERIRKVSRH